jgi:arylformamidase
VIVRIYDITIPLQASIAVWPGDVPYRYEFSSTTAAGDGMNLGAVTMSAHTGAHADAPFHFRADGQRMEEVDLLAYVGRAVLVDVTGCNPIRPNDIPKFQPGPVRLLLKTGGWMDYSRFPTAIPVLAPETPVYLREAEVVLIGVDVPSVDAIESKELPNHRALDACGIRILESLYLAEAPPGEYELIALPLKLVGADGSPVRAILRTLARD